MFPTHEPSVLPSGVLRRHAAIRSFRWAVELHEWGITLVLQVVDLLLVLNTFTGHSLFDGLVGGRRAYIILHDVWRRWGRRVCLLWVLRVLFMNLVYPVWLCVHQIWLSIINSSPPKIQCSSIPSIFTIIVKQIFESGNLNGFRVFSSTWQNLRMQININVIQKWRQNEDIISQHISLTSCTLTGIT